MRLLYLFIFSFLGKIVIDILKGRDFSLILVVTISMIIIVILYEYTYKDIDDVVVYVRSFEKAPVDKSRNVDIEEDVINFESPYDLETTVKNITKADTSMPYN